MRVFVHRAPCPPGVRPAVRAVSSGGGISGSTYHVHSSTRCDTSPQSDAPPSPWPAPSAAIRRVLGQLPRRQTSRPGERLIIQAAHGQVDDRPSSRSHYPKSSSADRSQGACRKHLLLPFPRHARRVGARLEGIRGAALNRDCSDAWMLGVSAPRRQLQMVHACAGARAAIKIARLRCCSCRLPREYRRAARSPSPCDRR